MVLICSAPVLARFFVALGIASAFRAGAPARGEATSSKTALRPSEADWLIAWLISEDAFLRVTAV